MATRCSLLHLILTSVFLTILSPLCYGVDQERKVYIVYMGALPEGENQLSSLHVNMLRAVIGPKFEGKHLVRSYTRSFNAFAANLTEEEQEKISNLDGVVSVFPSGIFKPQTTRSWDFMGFPQTVNRNLPIECDIVVGVIDSGIWPESESFNDEGLGPVPSKWNGTCNGGKNFTCNNKIIGARWYTGEYSSARDLDGHGSHTASTAAGNNVKGISFYGYGKGTVRGAVTSARIAAYKVCEGIFCSGSGVLAAFDDAIADGVHIISVSIGLKVPVELYKDEMSIGTFHALENNILTIQSAGNEGQEPTSRVTSSVAPWLLTVAASSTDRRIINKVVLGNSTILQGNSIDTFKLDGEYPLVYGKEVTTECDEDLAKFCEPGCLDRDKVEGKIVLCEGSDALASIRSAGAVGAIFPTEEDDNSFVVPFPVALLGDITPVIEYIRSTKKPTARITISEEVTNPNYGVVAEFSSRGPNKILPEILKPDLTAPGIEILAAYSPVGIVTGDRLDKRSVNYMIMTGTSMSCPHTTGAAAYVKSFHPDWSPSAIKSALMTTAREMDPKKNKDVEFSYGAGHIDPVKATNPGLVYETTIDDYIEMVCTLDYTPQQREAIFGRKVSCPEGVEVYPKDLNYPSMSADIYANFTVDFKRRVTNVGIANSTYKATFINNTTLAISVEPNILSFKSLNEKKSFVVTVSGEVFKYETLSAALIWSDGTHKVRTPIVVH